MHLQDLVGPAAFAQLSLARGANQPDPGASSIHRPAADSRASRPFVTNPPKPSRSVRRKLTTSDYQALGAFRHALRKFLAFSEAGSDALGLTPQAHQALLAVRAHSGPEAMTVGELADCLLIRNHSALGLAERLIDRGLLVRAASAEDRRRVLLYLSDEGAGLLETISRNNLAQLQSTLPVFTDLLQALERLELPPPAKPPARASGKRRA